MTVIIEIIAKVRLSPLITSYPANNWMLPLF